MLPRLIVGADVLDQPHLLRLVRRLEHQAIDRDAGLEDLVDEAHPDLAGLAVHPGGAALPALEDDVGGAGLEFLAGSPAPTEPG